MKEQIQLQKVTNLLSYLLFVLVKITKLIVPEITLKGHDIKISCVAEGSSEVNYSFARWKENSISDLISSSFKYNVKDGELVIRNLSFDDNGKYSCFAKAGEEKNLQDIKMFSIQVQQLTPGMSSSGFFIVVILF